MLLCLCMTRSGQHAMGCCLSKVWPRWNVYASNRIVRHNPDYANRIVFRAMAEESAAQVATTGTSSNRLSYAGFEVTFEVTSAPSPTSTYGEEFLLRTRTFRYDNAADKATDSDNSTQHECDPNTVPVMEAQPSGHESVEKEVVNSAEGSQSSRLSNNEADFITVNEDHDNNDNIDKNDDNDNESTSSSQALVSCTICHIEIEDGERVGDLCCGHTFHSDCLKAWITRRNVCPLCLEENIATPRPTINDISTTQSQTTLVPELTVSGQ